MVNQNLCEYKRKKTILSDQNLVWFANTKTVYHALDVLEARGVKITPLRQVSERDKQKLKKKGLL